MFTFQSRESHVHEPVHLLISQGNCVLTFSTVQCDFWETVLRSYQNCLCFIAMFAKRSRKSHRAVETGHQTHLWACVSVKIHENDSKSRAHKPSRHPSEAHASWLFKSYSVRSHLKVTPNAPKARHHLGRRVYRTPTLVRQTLVHVFLISCRGRQLWSLIKHRKWLW